MTYNVIMTSKNNKKISSIDEFDRTSGKKIRTVNHCLYKSIDEYDEKTGKKVRTINFNSKDESKISSVQEYDIDTGKIISISIYKRDGKTVGIVKKFDVDFHIIVVEDHEAQLGNVLGRDVAQFEPSAHVNLVSIPVGTYNRIPVAT